MQCRNARHYRRRFQLRLAPRTPACFLEQHAIKQSVRLLGWAFHNCAAPCWKGTCDRLDPHDAGPAGHHSDSAQFHFSLRSLPTVLAATFKVAPLRSVAFVESISIKCPVSGTPPRSRHLHKIMFGYRTAGDAMGSYLLAYDDEDANLIMSITRLPNRVHWSQKISRRENWKALRRNLASSNHVKMALISSRGLMVLPPCRSGRSAIMIYTSQRVRSLPRSATGFSCKRTLFLLLLSTLPEMRKCVATAAFRRVPTAHLQAFTQAGEAHCLTDRSRFPVRIGHHEVVRHIGKRLPSDRDSQLCQMNEVTLAQLTSPLLLHELPWQ